MAADAHLAAGLDQLGHLLCEELERILALVPPARPPQPASEELGARSEARELRISEDVVPLVPVVLGPRSAVLDEQRRRVRGAALAKDLDHVLVERRDGDRVLDARVAVD